MAASTPAVSTPATVTEPSPEVLDALRAAGRAHYAVPGALRIAWSQPVVREAVGDRPVGDPGTLAIMRAWGEGFDAAADAAAWSALAD